MALHPRVIDLSLGRIERLLKALGHPERGLPPVLHIAGTNGKGSTLAYLRAMLEAGGFAVHLYTSPHLVRFNERIVVAGKEIADGDLIALLEECEAKNDGATVTFFEFTTAAALLAFSRTPADILLLETGLGGRLDATNLVARPAACAISPVGLDHAQFLGDELAGVAAEKAGILKPHVPAAIAPQPAEAMAAIEARAAEIGAPLYRAGAEWRFERAGEALRYEGRKGAVSLPAPGLAGAHQAENAALALACLDLLDGFDIAREAKAAGLMDARWPARLQRLTRGPLVELLPAGWELWLDGGHNPLAGAALAAWAAADARPLHLVAALLDTKDAGGFLAPLAGPASSLQALCPESEHPYIPAARLAGTAASLGIAAEAAPSAAEAVERIVDAAPGPGRILICGSLYFAGEVLKTHA